MLYNAMWVDKRRSALLTCRPYVISVTRGRGGGVKFSKCFVTLEWTFAIDLVKSTFRVL